MTQSISYILTAAPSFAVPHTWGAAYSGAVCDDPQQLHAWLAASNCFAVSIDSRAYSRLEAACAAAKNLGRQKLRVAFCWSPFPEPKADGTPNTHGAGSFSNPDVMLTTEDQKWIKWREYWSARLTGWTQAWQRACGTYGQDFIEPCCVVDAEAFNVLSPPVGVTGSRFDVALKAIYDQVIGYASVFSSGGQYWYGRGDAREVVPSGDRAVSWLPNGYFGYQTAPGDALCPVGYFGHDVHRSIRRIAHAALLTHVPIAPFWSPCLEVAPGFVYERDIVRAEEKPLDLPAGKTWLPPWRRAQSVQLGAYFAELAAEQKLVTVITWPGPGTPTCEPDVFAQRFADVAAGVACAIGN